MELSKLVIGKKLIFGTDGTITGIADVTPTVKRFNPNDVLATLNGLQLSVASVDENEVFLTLTILNSGNELPLSRVFTQSELARPGFTTELLQNEYRRISMARSQKIFDSLKVKAKHHFSAREWTELFLQKHKFTDYEVREIAPQSFLHESRLVLLNKKTQEIALDLSKNQNPLFVFQKLVGFFNLL